MSTISKVALLNLAWAEVQQHGHVLDTTRQRLVAHGVTSFELEQYLNIVGAN